MWVEESSSDFSLLAGENVEELFTRIAIMAFENIMMKEVKSVACHVCSLTRSSMDNSRGGPA